MYKGTLNSNWLQPFRKKTYIGTYAHEKTVFHVTLIVNLQLTEHSEAFPRQFEVPHNMA